MSGSSLYSTAWLIAQGDYVHLGRRFRQGGENVDPTAFAFFMCALVAILAIALIASRAIAARKAPGYFNERRLFRELCHTHQLDWTNRRLLRRLAAFHGLDSPARLFLEPSFFESEGGDGVWTEYGDQIRDLSRTLFAPPTKEEPEAHR